MRAVRIKALVPLLLFLTSIATAIQVVGGAYVSTVFVEMYVPMGLRPAKTHEKQSRVAQTCRSLACLRPCREGAYIPPKYGGTYAPPWFFDPVPMGLRPAKAHEKWS
jgi:hypothetical protein